MYIYSNVFCFTRIYNKVLCLIHNKLHVQPTSEPFHVFCHVPVDQQCTLQERHDGRKVVLRLGFIAFHKVVSHRSSIKLLILQRLFVHHLTPLDPAHHRPSVLLTEAVDQGLAHDQLHLRAEISRNNNTRERNGSKRKSVSRRRRGVVTTKADPPKIIILPKADPFGMRPNPHKT